MASICQWKGCSQEAEAICKCSDFLVCRSHVYEHISEVIPKADVFHQPIPLILRISLADIKDIEEVINLANKKLFDEIDRILKVTSEIIRAINEKANNEIKRIMLMQQEYIKSLRFAISKTEVKIDKSSVVLREIKDNFENFKFTIKDNDWFALEINHNDIVRGVDSFIKLKIVNRSVGDIVGIDYSKLGIDSIKAKKEEKKGSETDSYADEIELDPDAF